MSRKLLLCLVLWLFGAALPALAETLTVNDGEDTNNYVPIYGYYCDSYLKCEYLVPGQELVDMESGTITGMTWYVSSPAAESWGNVNFKVFLKEVGATSLSGYSGIDEDATIVYEGTLDGTGSTINVEFTNPYVYEGGNLVVGVYNTAKGSWKTVYFFGQNVADGVGAIQGYSGNSLDEISANDRNFLPKTTFTYTPGSGVVYPRPTGLTVSNITPNGATLTWTPGGEETSWNVNYKKQADTEWTSAVVTTPTYDLEDLANGVAYDVRVQADYGDGNLSGWTIASFTTPQCAPEDMGQVIYELSDSYGDGWNGNKIQVVNSNGTVVETLTISSGNSASGTLNLCYGDTYSLVWVPGSYGYECSFTFTGPEGEIIKHVGSGSSNNDTSPSAGVLISFLMRNATCPRPTELTASNISWNSATLTWTPGNEDQDNWQVVYGTGENFNPDAEGLEFTTANLEPTLTLNNLSENTTYHVYVRSNCGEGDVSVWSDVCTFTTPEQFPKPTNLAATNVNARSAKLSWEGETEVYNLRYRVVEDGELTFSETFDRGIPDTWTVLDSDNDGNNWSDGLMEGENGVAFSASFDNSVGALTPDNWLITPQVTLGGVLRFKVGDVGYTENYSVYVSTNGLNDFVPIRENATTMEGLIDQVIDLSAYAGHQGYIAFRHHNITDAYYLIIDDVRIGQSSDVEWTTLEGVTSPTTITGLLPETDYEAQVQSVYDETNSPWTDAVGFKTAAVDITPGNLAVNNVGAHNATVEWKGVQETYNLRYRKAAIRSGFFEDFENGIPSDWSLIDGDGDTYNWYAFNPTANNMSNYDVNGSRTVLGNTCATSASYNGSVLNPDNWLVTPQVELKGTLSVWLRGQDPKYPSEKFAIYVSTTGNTVDDFTTVLVPETIAQDVYTEYTADLSAYDGQMGYIAIRHYDTSDEFRLNVDNFYIKWDDETPAGEWITLEGVDNPYTIEGLDAETDYEVQVQGVDISLTTDWTLLEPFTTTEDTEVTLAELLQNGVEGHTYQVTDALIMVAQSYNGAYTYVTDGQGNWARVQGLENAAFNTAAALTDVQGELSYTQFAPTITLTATPEVVSAEPVVIETLDWGQFNISAPCQVMNATGYFIDDMLCGEPDSELGVMVKTPEMTLNQDTKYDFLLAFEAVQYISGAPKRVEAYSRDMRAVILNASESTLTGVSTLKADTKTDVRYFDAQGRYVGKSLNNVPAGVYITSDGRKVIK